MDGHRPPRRGEGTIQSIRGAIRGSRLLRTDSEFGMERERAAVVDIGEAVLDLGFRTWSEPSRCWGWELYLLQMVSAT